MIAFDYNAIGIPVAAGVLYPYFGMLSSVSAIGNALRLRAARL